MLILGNMLCKEFLQNHEHTDILHCVSLDEIPNKLYVPEGDASKETVGNLYEDVKEELQHLLKSGEPFETVRMSVKNDATVWKLRRNVSGEVEIYVFHEQSAETNELLQHLKANSDLTSEIFVYNCLSDCRDVSELILYLTDMDTEVQDLWNAREKQIMELAYILCKKDPIIEMNYIGHSAYDYPSYKDNNGKIWLDINYGSAHGEIDLYSSSSNDLEGEPNNPIDNVYPDTEIKFGKIFRENPRKLDYMLLSRYKRDCDYFLSCGNGYEGHLYFHTVEKQIAEMKKLYNSFSEDEKPQWLTMVQIDKYHEDMKAKLIEVENKKREAACNE